MRHLLPLVLLAATFAAAPAVAQREPGPPRDPMRAVDFTGGTLGELLELLREQDTNFQYVLLGEGAADLPMPDVRLRGLTGREVIMLFDGMTIGGDALLSVDAGDRVSRIQVQFQRLRRVADDSPASRLDVFFLPPAADAQEQAANLDLLRQFVAMLGGEPRPKVRVHEATGAVVVEGTEQQYEALSRLFDRWAERAPRRPSESAQELRKMIDAMERELRVAQQSFGENSPRVVQLQEELERLRADLALLKATPATTRPMVELMPVDQGDASDAASN